MNDALRVAVIRAVIAGTVAWGGSVLGAVQYLASNEWAGASDLLDMVLWTTPFGAVVAIAAATLVRVLRAGNHRRACTWAVIIGPVLGLGSFYLAVDMRGGWVVAFPVFTCWAFGGLVGLLVVVGMVHPQSRLPTAGLAGAALAVLIWTHSVFRQIG